MKRCVLFFIMILLFVLNTQVSNNNSQILSEPKLVTPRSHTTPSSVMQYEDHDPIWIDGNNDFSNQSTTEGWSGGGTESNPYIIDGLKVTSITIKNTNVFFQISNCLLYKISIYHATNGKISENMISNSSDGIYLSQGGRHTISDNIISNHRLNGISLSHSNENTISNNTISHNGRDGISVGGLMDSENNLILSNTISNNVNYGVYLSYSAVGTSVTWNIFRSNNVGGLSQAFDYFVSKQNRFSYNYWDDWTDPDADSDGVVDNSYSIDGDANNVDPHPLAIPTTEPFTTTSTESLTSESTFTTPTTSDTTSESTPGFTFITWLIIITVVFLKRKPRHNQ